MKTKQRLLLIAGFSLAAWLTPCALADGPARVWAAQQISVPRQDIPILNRADKLYQEKNYAEAAKLMRPLAEKGNAYAAFALGLMEARGNLGEPDYAKARVWWEKAAEAGHPEAEYNLGLAYHRGVQDGGDGRDPSKRDFAMARQWWEKAAARGHGGAMYALGGMARTGEGQPKDPAKAAEWYGRAAEVGHPEAQYQLGSMYLNGSGVERNQAEAQKWMKKAADVGHPGAIQAMKLFKK